MSKPKLFLASVLGGAAMALSPMLATAQNLSPSFQNSKSADEQRLVDRSTRVVERMQRDPNLRPVLARAQGVLIVPNYGKGAFIVGGGGGRGVLLVHQGNGRWSNPAFYNLASGSVGAQIGGESGPIAFVLLSPHAINRLVGAHNVAFNANAGLTIADWSGRARPNVGRADVVFWSGVRGAMASAALGAASLTQDLAANDRFYRGHNINTVAILQGRAPFNPGARPLQQQLSAMG